MGVKSDLVYATANLTRHELIVAYATRKGFGVGGRGDITFSLASEISVSFKERFMRRETAESP